MCIHIGAEHRQAASAESVVLCAYTRMSVGYV